MSETVRMGDMKPFPLEQVVSFDKVDFCLIKAMMVRLTHILLKLEAD